MSSDQYNWVYNKLVEGPDDVVGALAYVLYKQHKIAFLHDFHKKHKQEPKQEELDIYHASTRTEEALNGFKERAERLADEFLEVALATKLQQAEELIRQSVLMEEVREIKADLTQSVGDAKAVVGTKLDSVISQLDGQRTALGWLREIGGNLAVNFATILLIGCLFTGYKWLSEWSSKAEVRSGVPDSTAGINASDPYAMKSHQ